MKILYRKSGSALLVALLIMSFVGAVGFGLARVSLFRNRLYTLNDASTGAFHAAEAGLEFALLQYSLDRDVELSWEKQSGDVKAVVPAYETNNRQNYTPVRYNLTNNQTVSASVAPSGNQEFDVTMYSHKYIIGEQSCFTVAESSFLTCGSQENPLMVLAEDENTSINVAGSVGDNLSFYLRVKQQGAPLSPTVQPEVNKGYGVLVIDTYGVSDNFLGQKVYILNESIYHAQITGDSGKSDKFLLNEIDGSTRRLAVTYYGPSNNSGGNSLALAFTAQKGDAYVPVDNDLTIIDVVGRAKGSSRRMQAKIDRRTDKVINIFDFALYASNSLSTPD